ncbi:MAG: hypothetical protein N3A57_07780, partial [Negativicutes bacterium]|nr:hypothetical protein [Negativicutes bacterium]
PRLPVPPAGDGWAVDGLERQRQPAILDGIDGVLGQLRVEMEGVVAVQSREQAEQMAGRIRGLPGYQAVKPLLELEWEIFFLTVASGELVGGEDVRHLLIRMEELCRLAQQVIGGSRLSQPKTVNTGAG